MTHVMRNVLSGTQPDQVSGVMTMPGGLTWSSFGKVENDDYGNPKLSKEQERMLFFGPRRVATMLDPYHSFSQENRVLPDAWAGRNIYVEHILIEQIKASQLFYMKELLPWKNFDGVGPRVDVKEIIFDTALLDQVPEQGVVRLVTQRFNQWSATIGRRGLGFIMEDGLAMTEQGKRDYAYSILQIRNATWLTLALGVCYALLNAQPYADNYWQQFEIPYPVQTLRDLFAFEHSLWGILNKGGRHGFMFMQQIGKEVLENRDVDADTIVLPFNTKDYYRINRMDETSFIRAGPKGPARLESKGGPIAAQAEFRVYESKKFSTGAHELPEDPFVRERTWGRFFVMREANSQVHTAPETLPAGVIRRMRNITVLDMDEDNLVELDYFQALRHTGVWDREGKITEDIGRAFFANYESVEQYASACHRAVGVTHPGG
jgi:hypothetical protein